MTDFPIVKVKTSDGLTLHGILSKPEKPTSIIKIHIHGTAGNFYSNSFNKELAISSNRLGIAQLATNNRGAGVYELEGQSINEGASLELFEDCLKDIDAWVEFGLNQGYEKIILEGHSFGTEKSVYYMEKGTYKDMIIAVILLGFSDNVGTMQKYLNNIDANYTNEAQQLIAKNEGHRLLNDMYGLAGEMPISAKTYINFTSINSENSHALPLRNGKDLAYFRNIKVPILGVIGDDEDGEYTIITLQEAIQLLKSENKLAEVHQITDCDHNFIGRENELAIIIQNFLQQKVLK